MFYTRHSRRLSIFLSNVGITIHSLALGDERATMSSSDSRYLLARRSAIYLLRVEAVILIGLALYLASASIFKSVTHPGALGAEIAFAIVGAVGLFLCSISYTRGTSWGRSPAVLANLIAIGVSYYIFGGKLYIIATALLILAAATLFATLLGYRPAD